MIRGDDMNCFNQIKNERGLTLLEVLLSIVILTIVLVSVMKFFPQMGMMNTQNQEKLESMNLTKKVLIDWQNRDDIKHLLKDESGMTEESIEGFKEKTEDHYLFEQSIDGYRVEITIQRASDLESEPTKAHQINIRFFDDKNIKIAETYGYIFYEG